MENNIYFTALRCDACGAKHDVGLAHPRCDRCHSVLAAHYDLDAVRHDIDPSQLAGTGMWRWWPILPVERPRDVVTLSEGDTPLIEARTLSDRVGLGRVFVKDEGRNPTGSFKDRGASVTVSRCRELAVEQLILASSGNAAVSFATYSDLAGLRFVGLIREETAEIHRLQLRMTTSEVFDLKGDMADGTAVAAALADRFGFFHCAQPYNLYRIEGKKMIAYEISEALDWQVPDRILLPTAGGTSALAIHKGYLELNQLGWVSGMPAIDVVQAEGCAPIVTAWRNGTPVKHWGVPRTKWVGLGHPFPAAGDKVVDVMEATDGRGWTVSDDACLDAACLLLRSEGMFVQPAAAAPLAAVIADAGSTIRKDELVVLLATGSGKNQSREPLDAIGQPPRIAANSDAIGAMLTSRGAASDGPGISRPPQ